MYPTSYQLEELILYIIYFLVPNRLAMHPLPRKEEARPKEAIRRHAINLLKRMQYERRRTAMKHNNDIPWHRVLVAQKHAMV